MKNNLLKLGILNAWLKFFVVYSLIDCSHSNFTVCQMFYKKFYNNANTFSGGRPIIAEFSLVTIGRSISLGCAAIA